MINYSHLKRRSQGYPSWGVTTSDVSFVLHEGERSHAMKRMPFSNGARTPRTGMEGSNGRGNGQSWVPDAELFSTILLCILKEARVPFAILGADAAVLYSNHLFVRWFAEHDAELARNVSRKVELIAIRQEIERAIKQRQLRLLALPNEKQPSMLSIFPLQEELLDQPSLSYAAVVVHRLGQGIAPDLQSLVTLFGLTKREAQIAADVASGIPASHIARKHGVTSGTVRVQLKSIFRKVGVGSQVELATKLYF